MDWTDAGHCWCADSASQPAQLAVQISQTVIPEYLVIEHIDPLATIDGDAMPKDIEVWAMIDLDQFSRAKDFEYAHFPNTGNEDPLTAWSFVKGRRVYLRAQRQRRWHSGLPVLKGAEQHEDRCRSRSYSCPHQLRLEGPYMLLPHSSLRPAA